MAGTATVASTTLVLLPPPEQDTVPAGHMAVPGKKSQHSPVLASLHGPGEPAHPAQEVAVGTPGSEKSLHSWVPEGHVSEPGRKAKHALLLCWHGPAAPAPPPLEGAAHAGHERGAGATATSAPHTNEPTGQRLCASAYGAQVPLPNEHTPAPAEHGVHTQGLNPAAHTELSGVKGAHRSVASCWHAPLVPA